MSYFLDLNGSLGALEIGAVLDVFLFGILTLQTFNYYVDFPDDSTFLKCAVGLVWNLELGYTASSLHALYLLTVTFYGQPSHILIPPHSQEIPILFSALIYAIVQTFFANRVRIISGHWYIMAFACVVGLLRLTGDILVFAILVYYSELSILQNWRWLVTATVSVGLGLDLSITVLLCYYLKKKNAEFKQTRTIAQTLILWAIESTVITSAASIIQIILFITRTDLTWIGFFLIQGKLFSNTMLASLNGRRRFRKSKSDVSDLSSSTSEMGVKSIARSRGSSASIFRDVERN